MLRPRASLAAACLLVLAAALADSTALAATSLKGDRIECNNEGEPVVVPIEWSSCFQCICKNGFVDCVPLVDCSPMENCAVTMPREGCCARCKGCWLNGTEFASHTEWSEPDGRLLRCEAGVITISRPECYAPCQEPKHQRHLHPNCPVCDQCVINGQRVWEGRDVRVADEPCLSCRCVHGALSCSKRACPVLPCPHLMHFTPQGECCPRCSQPTPDKILPGFHMKPCIIGQEFHPHNSTFGVDPCTDCRCMNGTSVCTRHTCPVLTCGKRALPPSPGKCCPECPHIEEAKAACVVGGKTYEDGETWQLDACKSCECHGGEPRCAMERCPALACPPHQTPRRLPAHCCAKCVDRDGICTVFGDPHYKTFDGKFYSFQGSCKYQLVSDCSNNTFSIRISNDARNTTHSSWTRTATLRIGSSKITMGRKMRIKVDGQRITLPHVVGGVAEITRSNGSVLLKADIGVQLLWDGDGFLEVTVSSVYKGKLCGLCGNFNSVARDDMTTRDGRPVKDEWKFGTSWRVGGRRACTRRQERPAKSKCRRERLKRAKRLCREFKRNEVFSECSAKMNPLNYEEACIRDACGCTGGRCHCAAYRAYTRECERMGAAPQRWAQAVWCEGEGPPGRAGRGPPRARDRDRDRDRARDREQQLLAAGARPRPSAGRTRPPPPILQ